MSSQSQAKSDHDAEAASDALLSVQLLDAGYGDLQILSDINLFVSNAEYVTIVGPNGAGK
jgi:branched-chain amino acid transport system ATP-binding protein